MIMAAAAAAAAAAAGSSPDKSSASSSSSAPHGAKDRADDSDEDDDPLLTQRSSDSTVNSIVEAPALRPEMVAPLFDHLPSEVCWSVIFVVVETASRSKSQIISRIMRRHTNPKKHKLWVDS